MADTAALDWVARCIAPGSTVVATRRLTGGVASEASAVRVQDPAGKQWSLVLRRFTTADPWRPDAVATEARVLRDLEATSIPAPRVVAVDPSGNDAGVPALLMLKLPGRIELRAERVVDYVEQIAALAALIHDDLPIVAPEARTRTWDASLRAPGPWSNAPDVWRRVAAALADPPAPTDTPRFIHGDLHPMNLLWTGTRLTGIVDWSLATCGQPARDIAHCRLNLAWLHGPELPERLRRAWEAETGWTLDPWWDLFYLANWGPGWNHFLPRQVGRRVKVDWAGTTARVEALIRIALDRLR